MGVMMSPHPPLQRQPVVSDTHDRDTASKTHVMVCTSDPQTLDRWRGLSDSVDPLLSAPVSPPAVGNLDFDIIVFHALRLKVDDLEVGPAGCQNEYQ